MKKFLLIGFVSFFAFLNTTYAVDYKKNVDEVHFKGGDFICRYLQ